MLVVTMTNRTASKAARIDSIYAYYRTCFDTACAVYRAEGNLDATTEVELREYYAAIADRKVAAVR